jgi:hypothetical protein
VKLLITAIGANAGIFRDDTIRPCAGNNPMVNKTLPGPGGGGSHDQLSLDSRNKISSLPIAANRSRPPGAPILLSGANVVFSASAPRLAESGAATHPSYPVDRLTLAPVLRALPAHPFAIRSVWGRGELPARDYD